MAAAPLGRAATRLAALALYCGSFLLPASAFESALRVARYWRHGVPWTSDLRPRTRG
jgi:hypothetical protein